MDCLPKKWLFGCREVAVSGGLTIVILYLLDYFIRKLYSLHKQDKMKLRECIHEFHTLYHGMMN